MILVFIFIVLLFLCILIILLSNIRINISKLDIENDNRQSQIIKDYTIHFVLYLFNKIRLINLGISKKEMQNWSKTKRNKIEKIKQKMKKIELEEIRKGKIDKNQLKELVKKLKIKVEYFNLTTEIGTEDVLITTAVVAMLSAAIGIGLARVIKKYDSKKYFYEIKPIYQNKNMINLTLKCIICIKMVHIIHIIYFLYKIRRVEKNERTSNRGTYDYSYE